MRLRCRAGEPRRARHGDILYRVVGLRAIQRAWVTAVYAIYAIATYAAARYERLITRCAGRQSTLIARDDLARWPRFRRYITRRRQEAYWSSIIMRRGIRFNAARLPPSCRRLILGTMFIWLSRHAHDFCAKRRRCRHDGRRMAFPADGHAIPLSPHRCRRRYDARGFALDDVARAVPMVYSWRPRR